MNKFTCCFVKDFSEATILQAINDYKPVFYMSGQYHMQALSCMDPSGHDLSSLVCVMPNGGMVSQGCVERLHAMLPSLKMVYQFYGSTEVGGVASTMDVSSSCLGALASGVTVYIRDLETGDRRGQGEVGEIMVRTGTTMKGYLNNETASKELYDEEGFVHMGDLGYYDSQGKLYFKDRIKEVIKCQNKWFGPSEVEESIESIPGVVEACIWSTYDVLKCDDIVHAAVTVNKADITKETIITHVSNNLPSHKHITGQIFFLDSIPHNPQGKKMRRVLILKQREGRL